MKTTTETVETLYRRKPNGRYEPVSMWDPVAMDALPKGAHLVVVEPGVRSFRYNVEPTAAPLLAALRMARDRVVYATRNVTKPRPRRNCTRAEKRAWDILQRELPGERLCMERASIIEIVEAMENELARIVQEGEA